MRHHVDSSCVSVVRMMLGTTRHKNHIDHRSNYRDKNIGPFA